VVSEGACKSVRIVDGTAVNIRIRKQLWAVPEVIVYQSGEIQRVDLLMVGKGREKRMQTYGRLGIHWRFSYKGFCRRHTCLGRTFVTIRKTAREQLVFRLSA